MKRVALIIPDAGPLISLGKAKNLEILFKLDLPIDIQIINLVSFRRLELSELRNYFSEHLYLHCRSSVF